MSELVVSLAAASALALVVVANIVRSSFIGSSRPEWAAGSRPRRFEISPTAFLLSRRARQAFFDQVRVRVGFASRQAYRLSGRGTTISTNAGATAGDRIWVVPEPAVRRPFEHVLTSNQPFAASGSRKAARLDIGRPTLGSGERHFGPVLKLRPVRHATRHWPAPVRARA